MPRNGYLPPPPAYLAVFAVMPRCGRTRTQERKRSSPRKGKTQPRKSMHPSVSSSCVICLLWRFISLNDSKSLRPTQAGILEIEVLRVFWDVNARQHRNAAWKAALPVRRLARRARPTLRPRRSAALPPVVSMSHITPADLGSQVSCPRAHTHLAGGGRVRHSGIASRQTALRGRTKLPDRRYRVLRDHPIPRDNCHLAKALHVCRASTSHVLLKTV